MVRSCLSAFPEHVGGTYFSVLTLVSLRWWGRAALRSGGSGALIEQPRSQSQNSLGSFQPSIVLECRGFCCWGSTCCTLTCGWTDTVLGLGRQAQERVLHTPQSSWENAAGEPCQQAPCGRALPEVSRQRVAELHGAASDIKPLRFLCLADLQSQALLSCLG